MIDETEGALVLRCRNGDRTAFDALLTRYERQVFDIAFRILHDREDAIDVTQTTFLRAYEHFERYDAGRQFRSWLYRIAVNDALDLVRARRHPEALSDELADEHGGPEDITLRGQDDGTLQRALATLRAQYRTVIVLKHLQGCSYDEIAEILDCPVKTVKARLFTARQALRDVLVEWGYLR
jgi:RNA polymerase sigma-70 factor (ECF subfamily)